MATILENIHAIQFSIFLFAIHHIAVIAEEETSESKMGVLLFVHFTKTANTHPQFFSGTPAYWVCIVIVFFLYPIIPAVNAHYKIVNIQGGVRI